MNRLIALDPGRSGNDGDAPDTPGSVTIPDGIRYNAAFTVSWAAASDTDGNLSGYRLERQINGGAWGQVYQGASTSWTQPALGHNAAATVNYRVKAYDANGAESGYRTGTTRSVINNFAPNTPGSVTVPATVIGGGSLTVSWAAASDPDGNLGGYTLEQSVNGGSYARVYQGAALSCAVTVTKGWKTVQYRVCSYDTAGLTSAWQTGPSRTVDNAVAPVISAPAGSMGVKSADFSWQYTVAQADGEATTVAERIDGALLRSYTAALGQASTFAVTGETFLKLLNTSHTMTVTATAASGKSAVYTATFTKAVHAMSITLAKPLMAEAFITKAVMQVTGEIPADAQYSVLMTNNANDPTPAWEDVTAIVRAGRNHVFANKVAVNGYAFNFRIAAARGESGAGGYVASVGGAFE